MQFPFNRVFLAAACGLCAALSANAAPWLDRPVLNAWKKEAAAVHPAQAPPLPPGVEMMAVCTSFPAAQPLVLEGMTHLLSFGDMKAYRKFSAALKLDPDCLMAHWGVCMSLMAAGPEFQKERVESMKSMKELALHPAFPEHERAYADALAVLLMDGPEEARKAWKTLYETWPRDPYAPLFYAMLLRDGFDDRGKPGEGQEEAVRIVDEVLKKRPGSQAALFMRALLDEVAPVIPPETVETARRAWPPTAVFFRPSPAGPFPVPDGGLSGRLRRL